MEGICLAKGIVSRMKCIFGSFGCQIRCSCVYNETADKLWSFSCFIVLDTTYKLISWLPATAAAMLDLLLLLLWLGVLELEFVMWSWSWLWSIKSRDILKLLDLSLVEMVALYNGMVDTYIWWHCWRQNKWREGSLLFDQA